MAMRNANWHACLLRRSKRKNRQRADMTMNDWPALPMKQRKELFLVSDNTRIRWNYKDAAAERFYFLARNQSRPLTNKKIELHPRTIDMPIIIHDCSFNAAAIHVAHHLGNAYGRHYRPVLLLPNITPNVPRMHFTSMRRHLLSTYINSIFWRMPLSYEASFLATTCHSPVMPG